MDPALCLRYGSLPSLPLRFKYTNMSTATRLLTKPHFSFNPSPLSFSNGSVLRQAHQTFGRHVVYALDRFSIPSKEDHCKGNDNVIVRGTFGASLVMACVVAIMGSRAIAAPPKSLAMDQYSVDLNDEVISPFGAKGALKSLFAVGVKLATSDDTKEDHGIFRRLKKRKPSKFDEAPKMPSIEQIAGLKTEAVKLIKAGKNEEAENQLRNVYENAKDKHWNYLNESAYFAQMALVEILMAQGKYSEASKCECLKIPEGGQLIVPSDGRFYLYKAIISTMMNDTKEAKTWWQKFTEEVVCQSSPYDKPSYRSSSF
ncbi:hypothetical protein FNV43_RR06010 [Rhamnella rubrinervis]|uniref:Uncharacterized protein n=1 Tax=Rhamnella rubrinervis TaxID=2594499 RepID=A0A8K0MKX3_9ROSA|nr:hypothetical protein FNV43_RR06010 [Rhamnella rubrinervis]